MPTKKVIFADDLLLSVRDDPEIDGKNFARFKEHIDNAPDAVKHGRWLPQVLLGQRVWDCSECKTLGSPHWKRCPVCEAKMDLPQITEQTKNALVKMGEKAHGDGNGT
jgi:rubrerythrin